MIFSLSLGFDRSWYTFSTMPHHPHNIYMDGMGMVKASQGEFRHLSADFGVSPKTTSKPRRACVETALALDEIAQRLF